MGIDYYLANKKDKLIYELGRGGPWYTIFDSVKYRNTDKVYFLYRDTFVDYFIKEMTEFNEWREITDSDRAYWIELANELFDFFDGVDPEDDLILANDSDDSLSELRKSGYILIASRYKNDSIEEYNDYIRSRNPRANLSFLSNIDLSLSISRIKRMLPFM